MLAPPKRPVWLRVDRLLGEWGIAKDSPAERQWLEQALAARRGPAEGGEFKPIRHGWCLRDEIFRQELLAQMRGRMGAEHYGAERAQTAEAMAEQIIAAELKRRRWQEAELRTRPRGDAEKVAFIARGSLAGSTHYQEPSPAPCSSIAGSKRLKAAHASAIASAKSG